MLDSGRVQAPVLGIDLGGTKILAAVVDQEHRVVGRAKNPTPAQEGEQALRAALEATALEAIEAAGLQPGDLLGCGVGSPGPLDLERGIILRSPNLNVKDFPLGPGLSERLGVPVRVWNDVRVGGYGEFRLGAGRGFEDLLVAFIGTGIGGCVIVAGRMVLGMTGNAGEIGHVVVKAAGPRCGCGQRGCLEAVASRTAMVKRIAKAAGRGEPTVLGDHFEGRTQRRVKSKELAAAYFDRDPVVVREVDRAARFLGLGLASLINVLDPQRVIVGGGVVEALGESYLAIVRDAARPHILADSDTVSRIVPSGLGDDAGVLGAALLARETFAPATVRDAAGVSTE
ncbi:MAG: glucokinase [Isosphaeraceae bacterium]|jgi:glucokinase|nr:MAG: glucokinase [Isosphaeraceae bacterium]